jgi:hypothetical protein
MLCDEPDLELLRSEYNSRIKFFWTFALLIVFVVAPIGALGRFYHPNTEEDYLLNLKVAEGFVVIWMLYLYFQIPYKIKKDIKYGTKFRIQTSIRKTNSNETISKNARYCDILLITSNTDHEIPTRKSLLYYLIKNVFPMKPNTISVRVPKEKYINLVDGKGIIDISYYSKTFLNFKKE